MLRRILPFLAGWLIWAAGPAFPGWAQGQTQVSLRLDHLVMTNGGVVDAAVELAMPDGWHTYWINPSDSGLGGKATTIEWDLPPGVSAGPIRWPTPTKLKEDDVTVYAYEGKVTLLIPITLASNAPTGLINIKAKVEWLECKTQCLPGSAEVSATLQSGPAAIPSPEQQAFTGFRSRLPEPQRFPVGVRWVQGKDDTYRDIQLSFEATEGVWDFFPFPIEGIVFQESKEGRPGAGGQVLVAKSAELDGGTWPAEVAGLLTRIGADGHVTQAYEIRGSTASEASFPPAAISPPRSFALLLLFAFVGGLILNIMPCVLPVIALKILGFVRQAQESPGRVRLLGFTYGAGVLSSFAVLAGVMIALNLANKSVHQGVLFQSSTFLVGMTALVVLIALNLFGVFEVTLGSSTMESADALARKEGISGAFFNGVLATVLATPCSAPFLSLSLGFALQPGQKPQVTLALYLMAGLGLALPYIALSCQPRWLRLLPKPGPWMVRFKTIMGFPMLGTAVWLFLLTANHYDKGSLLWLGMFLVVLALAAWVFGEFIQRGSRGRLAAWVVTLALLAGGYFWMLEREADWRHPAQRNQSGDSQIRGKHKVPWETWSPEAVETARAAGRPVFVDFTADYCTTCQANARTSIEVPAVIQRLKEINATPLLADFSRPDPRISAELRRYQRSGVPLVLVYPAKASEPPRVLPEILTEGVVLEALDWAANTR